MTIATSLMLIAVGAILAFAVSFELVGINIQTVGVILMVVGGIGLAFAMAILAGYAPWGAARAGGVQPTQPATNVNVAGPTNVTPPTV
jgi:uncharacterized membrane-anchored protein